MKRFLSWAWIIMGFGFGGMITFTAPITILNSMGKYGFNAFNFSGQLLGWAVGLLWFLNAKRTWKNLRSRPHQNKSTF